MKISFLLCFTALQKRQTAFVNDAEQAGSRRHKRLQIPRSTDDIIIENTNPFQNEKSLKIETESRENDTKENKLCAVIEEVALDPKICERIPEYFDTTSENASSSPELIVDVLKAEKLPSHCPDAGSFFCYRCAIYTNRVHFAKCVYSRGSRPEVT